MHAALHARVFDLDDPIRVSELHLHVVEVEVPLLVPLPLQKGTNLLPAELPSFSQLRNSCCSKNFAVSASSFQHLSIVIPFLLSLLTDVLHT